MSQLFYFLIAIIIIVAVHEFGHYIIARLFGVKVERFSVGFGKVLLSKTWHNTEWCLSLIPLGGYVRMLDTRMVTVSEEDRPYAFDLQAPWKKILIYLAGPLINLVLGAFLFSVVFYHSGVTTMQPQVNMIAPGSLAEKAGFQVGDFILSINQEPAKDFSQVSLITMENLENGELKFEVKDGSQVKHIRHINTNEYPTEVQNIILGKSGFGFFPHKISNQLEKVLPGGRADKAGLQKDDVILALNHQKIEQYSEFLDIIRQNPERPVEILFKRGEKKLTTVVIPENVQESKDAKPIGRIGVQNKIDETLAKKNRHIYYPSLLDSVKMAIGKTAHISKQTVVFLGRMLIGRSSLMNISGPVTTANYASEMASLGIMPYLMFLALISISIGILNLLPIPVLDGGGVLFSFIEWIRGKPLSERAQELFLCFGFLFVVLLMFIAFFNDFVRIFG